MRLKERFKFFYFKRNRQLKASEYGTKDGWFVELEAKRIVELTDPLFEDMFWFSYKVKVIDPSFKEAILEQVFWENTNLKFLSKALNEYYDRTPIVSLKINTNGVLERLFVRSLHIDSV